MAGSTNMNVNLADATDVVCESCGSKTFSEVVFIKRVSALLSPNGKEGMVPVQTFCCRACGHVNKEFDPSLPKT